jgi:iron complex transport system ATP-binding protein
MALDRPQKALLKAYSLTYAYGEYPVFQDVSLELFPGEILGIIGPNGSGKSTLLGLLSGLLSPNNGRVLLKDKEILKTPRAKVAETLGLSPQNPQLSNGMTALETALSGRYVRMGRNLFEDNRDLAAAEKALKQTGLTPLAARQCGQLSGGERQRLALARALAAEPQVLLLDEPTSALDMDHQLKVMEVLECFSREDHRAVCLVSHDLNLSSMFCDRLLLLAQGKALAQGRPKEVLRADLLEKAYGVRTHLDREPTRNRPRITLIPRSGS